MSTELTEAIRAKAEEIHQLLCSADDAQTSQKLRDAVTLLRVLANIIGGMPVALAMGAPGDWGYDTPIGCGLVAYRKSPAAHGHAVIVQHIPSARK